MHCQIVGFTFTQIGELPLFVAARRATDDWLLRLWRMVPEETDDRLLTFIIMIPLASIAIGIAGILWHYRRTVVQTIAWNPLNSGHRLSSHGLLSLTIDLFSPGLDAHHTAISAFVTCTLCTFAGWFLKSLISMDAS
jgi:hypothetical protein